jgi:hypothetical protein
MHKLLHSDILGLEYAAAMCTGSMYTANNFWNVTEFALKIVSKFYGFSVQHCALLVQSSPHLHTLSVQHCAVLVQSSPHLHILSV